MTAAEVRVVDEQTPSAFGSLQRLIQQSPLINSQLRIQAPMMILFRDQVAQQLAELTDPVAWTRLMLRLSAEEPLLHVDSKKKKSELASSEAALTFRAVALLDEHKGAKGEGGNLCHLLAHLFLGRWGQGRNEGTSSMHVEPLRVVSYQFGYIDIPTTTDPPGHCPRDLFFFLLPDPLPAFVVACAKVESF